MQSQISVEFTLCSGMAYFYQMNKKNSKKHGNHLLPVMYVIVQWYSVIKIQLQQKLHKSTVA